MSAAGNLIMDPLKRAPLFSGFSDRDFEDIRKFSKYIYLEHGRLVFAEGESCSAVYCVVEGLVKLFVRGPRKQVKIIEFIAPGETFAEAAMFSGQGYPVSSMTIEDSKLIAVDAYSFMRYVRGRPDLSWKMLAVMSGRLHQLVGQIKSMCLHNAEQKFANYLLEHFDSDSPNAPVDHLPSRRAELASVLGITAETLCRVIAGFRRLNYIETQDSAITVTQPDALRGLLAAPPREGDACAGTPLSMSQ